MIIFDNIKEPQLLQELRDEGYNEQEWTPHGSHFNYTPLHRAGWVYVGAWYHGQGRHESNKTCSKGHIWYQEWWRSPSPESGLFLRCLQCGEIMGKLGDPSPNAQDHEELPSEQLGHRWRQRDHYNDPPDPLDEMVVDEDVDDLPF